MKVHSVSFKSKKNNSKYDYHSLNAAFLYTPTTNEKVMQDQGKKFKLLLGSLALLAVSATLMRLKGGNKLPETIAEISNPDKGLNKLKGFEQTVDELKSKIVYPLKASILGDMKMKKNRKFGLILTDNNSENPEKILNALQEHFKELGVDTISIPKSRKRNNSKGETINKKLNRSITSKMFYTTIKSAEKKFKDTGKYTVINIGDLSDFTDLKVIKSLKSNFEEFLENLNKNKYSGVLWMGWTTKSNSLPLFFSDLPILITKVLD